MSCAETLKTALAETFLFYMEAHFFHWNVEGATFSQLHDLFGEIYEDADDAMDGLAEHIRTLGEYAPMNMAEMTEGARIVIDGKPDATGMVAKLAADNELVIAALSEAEQAAEADGKPQIANYLQERMDAHAKWGWMLKATTEPPKARHKILYDHARSMR